LSDNSELERSVKEAVKCKLNIPCSVCMMINVCMMKMIQFYEGEDVAMKCPNCGHVMEYFGDYWKCPNCLHRTKA
jgi:tRNA(Ile2) C34 agmatinyltransferase TiaS